MSVWEIGKEKLRFEFVTHLQLVVGIVPLDFDNRLISDGPHFDRR